ncbi:MAG: CDP-diacylglycerol--glycerol-3-phosphate 3-phosphatidyltransferase [Planctomycetota bacterium]|nr:MAG: CDP-diacylglycerol--glycerol-3-phosphate 3-phosphatidyltransferase [Planctomycetota bacterium]
MRSRGRGVAVKRRRRLPLREQITALPNRLTALRLVLAAGFFGLLIYCTQVLKLPVDASGELAWQRLRGGLFAAHAGLQAQDSLLTRLFDGAFALFVLAALTDVADGYVARRWKLETDLGRIADPFADKVMTLGAFVLLMPLTVYLSGWMVVLMLAREQLVTTIRGFAESRGVPFPANVWGKAKTATQSVAIGAGILYVGHPSSLWLRYSFVVLLWLALGATLVSGLVYVRNASRLLFRGPAHDGAP